MSYLNELKDETLLLYYANAKRTYYGCTGHLKAARNKERMVAYADEIKGRGLALPEDGAGEYNGPGSW